MDTLRSQFNVNGTGIYRSSLPGEFGVTDADKERRDETVVNVVCETLFTMPA